MRPRGLLRLILTLVLACGMGAMVEVGAATSQPSAPRPSAETQQVLVLLPLPPPHFRGRLDYAGAYGDGLGRSARRRIATRIAHDEGLALVDAWVMPVIGVDCFVMSVPPGRSAAEAAQRISGLGSVAWAEPMAEYRLQAQASRDGDPLFRAQPAAQAWRLADLHRTATGRDVKVAVIDSMVDARHPDLVGQVALVQNLLPGRPPNGEAHGTAVAGIIAARENNGQGIAGVAPGARLLALRACRQTDSAARGAAAACDTLSLARALVSAMGHKAEVVNLSLSGPPTQLLGRLLDVAIGRGATVVAAFDSRLPGGGFPASHPGVVAVSDEPVAGRKTVYLAPGRDVPTTQPGGGWGLVAGGSYAAAHVSGLFALMRERRGTGPLTLVADRPGAAIDACASVVRAGATCACPCAAAETARSAAP
ncbi:S8 family peptidase [Phenylobacterium sp.]|jgi:subtilisin family serine protease|uniref:S8 family peptidase n=1 Tax=Phenylobacterium sp. TaxID=1871053 RepID=UPI00378514FF